MKTENGGDNMQGDEQKQSRIVDMLHNQDKTLKESLDLYNGGTLDFLDDELSGEVTDILSTEFAETTTKKSYADKALKVRINGAYEGLHKEWEADISQDDLKRFGSSNMDLSRLHKIDFTTVIITAKKPSVTSYKNKSINFTPKIIDLSARDADVVLVEIDRKLKAGKKDEINLLEIIYLPLYGSKSGKKTPELFDMAIKLTPQVVEDKNKQQKLQDLLILLTSTFINDADFRKVLEVNMRVLEDSTAVRVIGDWSRNQTLVEVAKNMLRRGRNIQEVAEDTGLDSSRVAELQEELHAPAGIFPM
ncbi:MAG: hypothetical protein FWB80_11035 [Defluviitaleaceae bacterium]|nr:hypothetical protein [Defluviitaleaceae bacterium]